MNNTEREQWIDNDEGLYHWWRTSGMGKMRFIREHKAELDACINNALNREPGR